MKFRKSIISLGLLVALTPFIGIPGSWKTILLLVVGSVIAVLGYFAPSKIRKSIRSKIKQSNKNTSPAKDDAEETLRRHEKQQHPPENHIAQS